VKLATGSRSSLGLRLVLAAMLLYSLLSLGRAVTKQVSSEGGFDFHLYWYYGHHVRQGDNPYKAFFERQEPHVPVRYVDRPAEEQPIVPAAPFIRAPANTAPLMLLLSAFSFLSWPVARWVWFALNLAIALLTPWMIIRLLPRGVLSAAQAWFIGLSYYVLSGTRIALWMGQTTLVVFALMLGALLTMSQSWLISGALLGLALSKFSVALPVLVFALFRRKYRVLAVSAIVQALGLLAIAWLGQESPLSVLGQYARMFSVYAALPQEVCQQCIHLANFLLQGNRLAYLATYAIAALILVALWIWTARSLRLRAMGPSFAEFHLFTVLGLGSLLVVYHHSYDSGIGILFVCLLVSGLVGNLWGLSTSQRQGLWLFLAAFILALNLPGEILGAFLSGPRLDAWMRMVNEGMTVGLLSALGVSLWLLLRPVVQGNSPDEAPVERAEVS
jgi:hypothetical protein